MILTKREIIMIHETHSCVLKIEKELKDKEKRIRYLEKFVYILIPILAVGAKVFL